MAGTTKGAGAYDLRVTILPRVLAPKGSNAEEVPSWPGPGKDYFACRDVLSAGEVITQGIQQATGSMKLRIKGRSIVVGVECRLRKKATGELFEITGVWRDSADTILLCERVNPQSTGQ